MTNLFHSLAATLLIFLTHSTMEYSKSVIKLLVLLCIAMMTMIKNTFNYLKQLMGWSSKAMSTISLERDTKLHNSPPTPQLLPPLAQLAQLLSLLFLPRLLLPAMDLFYTHSLVRLCKATTLSHSLIPTWTQWLEPSLIKTLSFMVAMWLASLAKLLLVCSKYLAASSQQPKELAT